MQTLVVFESCRVFPVHQATMRQMPILQQLPTGRACPAHPVRQGHRDQMVRRVSMGRKEVRERRAHLVNRARMVHREVPAMQVVQARRVHPDRWASRAPTVLAERESQVCRTSMTAFT